MTRIRPIGLTNLGDQSHCPLAEVPIKAKAKALMDWPQEIFAPRKFGTGDCGSTLPSPKP